MRHSYNVGVRFLTRNYMFRLYNDSIGAFLLLGFVRFCQLALSLGMQHFSIGEGCWQDQEIIIITEIITNIPVLCYYKY